MTPTRCLVLAALVAVLAGAPASAQERAFVRVDADDVVVHDGQAYVSRGGRYERVVVRRDQYGRPGYYRIVSRHRGYGYGYGGQPYYDTEPYRAPSTRVDCSNGGNCTMYWYDPRYDRRLYRGYGGYGYRGDRGGHRDRGDHRGDDRNHGARDDD